MPLVSSVRTPTARKKPFIGWVVPYGYQYFQNTNADNTVEQYTFVVPSFVFQLAICCIGGGGTGGTASGHTAGGGGGGALHWRNIEVAPGDVLYVQVGHRGTHTNLTGRADGGESYVKSGSHSGEYLLRAGGGNKGEITTTHATSGAPVSQGLGGINYSSTLGGGGGDGGQGGNGYYKGGLNVGTETRFPGGGGGGTGGYNGNGGIGAWIWPYISGGLASAQIRHASFFNSGSGYSGSGGRESGASAQTNYGELVGPDGVQSDDTENHFHESVNDHGDAVGLDNLYVGSGLPHTSSPANPFSFGPRYGAGGGGCSAGFSSDGSTNPGDGGQGVVRIAYGRIAGKSEDVSYPYKASPNGIGW